MSEMQELIKRVSELGVESVFGKFYSIYRGEVIDNKDPDDRGRVKARVPAVGFSDPLPDFIEPAFPFAGADRGFFTPPEIGDRIWVMFEGGDIRAPMYVGSWFRNPRSGTTNPAPHSEVPTEVKAKFDKNKSPQVRIYKTAKKLRLVFDDEVPEIEIAGPAKIRLKSDPGGSVVGRVEIKPDGVVEIDANVLIKMGAGVQSFVRGEDLLNWLITHTHSGVQSGGSISGTPTTFPMGILSQKIRGE